MPFPEVLFLCVVVILMLYAPTLLHCFRSSSGCDEVLFFFGGIGMLIFLSIIMRIASLLFDQAGQAIFVISSWIAACLYGWYSAKK